MQPGVFRCPPLRLYQRVALLFRQRRLVAQNQDTNILLVQFINFGRKEIQNQLHQRADFLLRALPVLRREGVDAQRLNLQVVGMADDFAQGFRALPMPHRHVQPMLFRPAAVAVHDDGDVARQLLEVLAGHFAVMMRMMSRKFPEPLRHAVCHDFLLV